MDGEIYTIISGWGSKSIGMEYVLSLLLRESDSPCEFTPLSLFIRSVE